MKKSYVTLLAGTMLLTGCAGTAQSAGEAIYKAGTYSGTAAGRNADVTVEVTLSDSAITDVKVTEHQETAGVADAAIEKIPAAIVENQSLAVETVSGATISSNAILAAVEAALTEAGADVEALKAKEVAVQAGEPIEKSADVIVVGAGGAGLSAALAATEEGKTVIIMEKTSSVGGNTLASGGVWNAVDPELDSKLTSEESRYDALRNYLNYDEAEIAPEFLETYKTLKEQINEYLESGSTTLFDSKEFHLFQSYIGGLRQDLDGNTVYGSYELLNILIENSLDTMQWLHDTAGSEFNDSFLIEPNGALWKRAHIAANSKLEDMFNRPKEKIEANGGEFIFDCAADTLLTDGGKVVGVHGVLGDGTEVTLHAENAVVLATGGFAANKEMVVKYDNYWGDILNNVVTTTNISATVGDGLVMAMEAVDAATTGLEYTQMNPIGFASNGALAQGNGGNVFYVNPQGDRFVNEYAERDVVSRAALLNGGEGGLFYEIGLKSQLEPSMALWQDADGYEAATIEELAGMIGIDPEKLAAETEKYNACVEAGSDPDFGKDVFTIKIETEGDDLYVARALRPSLHHTMGGLVIDSSCHVYNNAGEIVEGLFAAGEVTGGIHAGNRLGGNAIADVYTFGRIAGTNAANLK